MTANQTRGSSLLIYTPNFSLSAAASVVFLCVFWLLLLQTGFLPHQKLQELVLTQFLLKSSHDKATVLTTATHTDVHSSGRVLRLLSRECLISNLTADCRDYRVNTFILPLDHLRSAAFDRDIKVHSLIYISGAKMLAFYSPLLILQIILSSFVPSVYPRFDLNFKVLCIYPERDRFQKEFFFSSPDSLQDHLIHAAEETCFGLACPQWLCRLQ